MGISSHIIGAVELAKRWDFDGLGGVGAVRRGSLLSLSRREVVLSGPWRRQVLRSRGIPSPCQVSFTVSNRLMDFSEMPSKGMMGETVRCLYLIYEILHFSLEISRRCI